MDGKLQAILGDETALAKIAAIVKGASTPAEPPPVPTKEPMQSTAPVTTFAADDRLALLAALRPFLKESRRTKLDSITKVMNVASIYKNTKHI